MRCSLAICRASFEKLNMMDSASVVSVIVKDFENAHVPFKSVELDSVKKIHETREVLSRQASCRGKMFLRQARKNV